MLYVVDTENYLLKEYITEFNYVTVCQHLKKRACFSPSNFLLKFKFFVLVIENIIPYKFTIGIIVDLQ